MQWLWNVFSAVRWVIYLGTCNLLKIELAMRAVQSNEV